MAILVDRILFLSPPLFLILELFSVSESIFSKSSITLMIVFRLHPKICITYLIPPHPNF